MTAKNKLALRIAATVVLPFFGLGLAILLSVLTQWLDQFLGGKALLLMVLIIIFAAFARFVWTFPGWRDGE